jgi:hypothetical protein
VTGWRRAGGLLVDREDSLGAITNEPAVSVAQRKANSG